MARKEPQGGATSKPICGQCSGRGGKWVDKKVSTGKGKVESQKLWDTCPRCKGSGWL